MAATSPPINPPSATPPPAAEEKTLYQYGWREVSRPGVNGRPRLERIPLTLEDLLHPKWGDVILHNSVHAEDCHYLTAQFKRYLAKDPTALVLHDVQVVWNIPNLAPHVPDISVTFNVSEPARHRGRFEVALEGVRPTVLVEVVSPLSRSNDVDIKVVEYHRAGVEWYVIIDRPRDDGPARVVGYRWAPQGYQPIPADSQGRVLVGPIGILIGTRGNRTVAYDPSTGQELLDLNDVSQALDRETAARQAAEAEAELLKARLTQLEELLRRAGQPPSQPT